MTQSPTRELARALRHASPDAALSIRLAQFIDGFLPPREFHAAVAQLRGRLDVRRRSEEETWALSRLDELLAELAEVLAAGVRRYDAPAVAALRSSCKPVFSAVGGLGEAQELYSRYWQLRYEQRFGSHD